MIRPALAILIAGACGLPSLAKAQCVSPSATAETVHLRQQCTIDDPDDCFEESTGCGLAALNAWIWTGASPRNPTAAAPLVVEVGPGVFAGQVFCPSGGHVTFRGQGRDATFFKAPVVSGVWSAACEGLEFQDLEIDASTAGTGLFLIGGGSTTLTDVDVEALSVAVLDTACGGAAGDPPIGEHRIQGSRLTAASAGISADCARLRVDSSLVRVAPDDSTAANSATGFVGIAVGHRADVEVFGSDIQVLARNRTVGGAGFHGVRVGPTLGLGATDHGSFRGHSGRIQVDTGNLVGAEAADANGMTVEAGATGDATGRARGAGFVLTSAATSRRLGGDGEIDAPQLRPAGEDPEPRWESKKGSDLFFETDCEPPVLDPGTGAVLTPGGCDRDPGTESHLMIHWPACSGTGGPWWDTAAGGCRQP